MTEQVVGSTFGQGSALDNRVKVGDERHGVAIEEMDARESSKNLERGKKAFYAKLGMQPPKDGEPDAQISAGDYLPGEIPVAVPKNGERQQKREAREEKPDKRERRAQPALKSEPEPVEAEEPVEEEAAEEAPDDEDDEITEEGVSPESDESGEEGDGEEPSSDLEEEATVLRRAKIPMSVIKKLTREESSRLTAILKVQQARMDDLGRQIGEAKNTESEDEPSAESGRVTPPEQPAKRSSVEPLLGILGDDAAPALESYDKSIDERLGTVKAELAAMYLDDMLDDARDGLKDRFPELLNDRFFKSIREEMSVLGRSKFTKLAGTTKRAKIQSLMERAALNAREAKGLNNGRAEKAPAAPARKHGTISPPKRTATPPKVGTQDRAEAAWGMLMQNIAPAEVRRRLDSRS